MLLQILESLNVNQYQNIHYMKLLQMKSLMVENNMNLASKLDGKIIELIKFDFTNTHESQITNMILFIGKLFTVMTGVIKHPY